MFHVEVAAFVVLFILLSLSLIVELHGFKKKGRGMSSTIVWVCYHNQNIVIMCCPTVNDWLWMK